MASSGVFIVQIVLVAALVIASSYQVFLMWSHSPDAAVDPDDVFEEGRASLPLHAPKKFAPQKTEFIASLPGGRLFEDLEAIAVPRVVGSPNHAKVGKFLIGTLKDLGKDVWDVRVDTFQASTPVGVKTFSNIVATLAPPNENVETQTRLVMAAHYDSKFFPYQPNFVGAHDSAASCAILLDIARTLTPRVRATFKANDQAPRLTLLFFDGEEAFHEWTEQDSIYGARHLAANWEDVVGSSLLNIRLLVLLDLIGTEHTNLRSHFPATRRDFERMRGVEMRMRRMLLIGDLGAEMGGVSGRGPFFQGGAPLHASADDHVPFLRRGVPVVHLISTPYPKTWHSILDSRENLDDTVCVEVGLVLRVFVSEYLLL